MILKNTNVQEFQKILTSEEQPVLAIFFGTGCEVCQGNIPEIIAYFNDVKCSQIGYLVNVNEEDKVWEEDKNKTGALKVVPTFRVYLKKQIVWDFQGPIKPKNLQKIVKEYINKKR